MSETYIEGSDPENEYTMKCQRCEHIYIMNGDPDIMYNADIDEMPNGYLRSIPDCPKCSYWEADEILNR